MNNEALRLTVYPYLSSQLRMRGCTKEVFAAIFNFWLYHNEEPVRASFSTLQNMTGATRPTVAKAVAYLVENHYIEARKQAGKSTLYQVTIPSEMVSRLKVALKTKLVKPDNQHNAYKSEKLTSSGLLSEPQSNNKNNQLYKNSIKKYRDPSLCVQNQGEIDTGGLPEVK